MQPLMASFISFLARVDFLLSLEGQQQFLLPESARLTGGVQHLRFETLCGQWFATPDCQVFMIQRMSRLCNRLDTGMYGL